MNCDHLAQVVVCFYEPGDMGLFEDDHTLWRKPFDETTDGHMEALSTGSITEHRQTWKFTEPNAGMEVSFIGSWNDSYVGCLLEFEVQEIGLQEVLGEDLIEELFKVAEQRREAEQKRIDGLPMMCWNTAPSKLGVHTCSFVVAFKAVSWKNAPDDYGVMAKYLGIVDLSRIGEIIDGLPEENSS